MGLKPSIRCAWVLTRPLDLFKKAFNTCLQSVKLVISMNVTIRGLDEAVYKRFKAKAIEEGMKIGEALTQAMEMWIKHRSLKPKASLLDVKPFNWGEGTEKVSVEIDQILYGEK